MATPDPATPDTATPDMAIPDTATQDMVIPDTATQDMAIPDMAIPGMAIPDTATQDTATPDMAIPDTAVRDTAIPDTAIPDTATPGTAVPDTAITDTATPDMATTMGRSTIREIEATGMAPVGIIVARRTRIGLGSSSASGPGTTISLGTTPTATDGLLALIGKRLVRTRGRIPTAGPTPWILSRPDGPTPAGLRPRLTVGR